MNTGYYGHANTLVFTYTSDDKYKKQAFLGGMSQIHISAMESKEAKESRLETMETDPNCNKYRRDYYGVKASENTDGRGYFCITEKLGYEEGESADNILSDLPEGPIEMLAVWDEGYGGLNPPDAEYIYWASDKVLPDKDVFEKIAEKCFLFLDGKVLRNAGAMISRQISWERTASDLIAELSGNPAFDYLLKARYIMITFELDGAVFIIPKGENEQLEAALLVTHGDVEGALAGKFPNQVSDSVIFAAVVAVFFGNNVAFAAAKDAGLTPKGEYDDFFTEIMDVLFNAMSTQGKASKGGFAADAENGTRVVKWGSVLRAILEAGETIAPVLSVKGRGVFDERDESLPEETKTMLRFWSAFLIPLVSGLASEKVPDDWTVIGSVGNREIYDVAFEYVQNGPVAIEGLPQFKLGALTTVDRWEIESYQNIRNLILDYDVNANSKRPLSIAVFGAPGSGKSFGVAEIATKVLPGKIEKLEFNVSQFVTPMDLGTAFQKVRDVIVTGKLPLVFFDEFDSDKDGMSLGWIKSFLMPMQDGKFRDESGEHPLGKCIIVFAGGTAVDFETFANPPDKSLFKNIKGPDFVSRLRGTINIVGPNPKSTNDQNHILRRALLLRSLIKRDRRIKNTQVSPSIIRAMLQIPEFKHGVRSMEAILDMSRIQGGVWKPASLPFHSQLALHVDGDAFLRLVAKG